MQRFSHVFTFVLMGALVCASLLTASVSASAQDSNPGATGSAFADLGLPELQVTVSDTGFEGIPDELEEASTPAGGEGEGQGGPPEVFYQSTFAGGTYARPGETSQVVLDLT
ncbi:MAG TPA: hypothetical protein VGR16_03690, partial [Thermomicrobiales bacterium]|nr:hypothetical protein [Thermomicrobiales bacterium]